MGHRITLTAAICGLALPLVAQNPGACIGKTVPLKPIIMMSCANATPSCLTDENGNNGRWIWSCPASASTTAAPTLSLPPFNVGDIPNAIRPASINNPLDTAIELQRLRQLQLENQQLQLHNQQQQQIDANTQAMSTWVLTNDLVIKLVKAGTISETAIVNVILTAIPSYSLATNDLDALRSAGVSERIIAAMVYRNPPAIQQAPTASATPTSSTPFPGGEVPVKLFREAMASKDKEAMTALKVYIRGLGNGIEWATASYQATKKVPPLFCPPDGIGFGIDNYIDLINVGLKTVDGAVERGFMTQADLDNSAIGSWLVAGFVQAFPCK